jgi:hypothetical protein
MYGRPENQDIYKIKVIFKYVFSLDICCYLSTDYKTCRLCHNDCYMGYGKNTQDKEEMANFDYNGMDILSNGMDCNDTSVPNYRYTLYIPYSKVY